MIRSPYQFSLIPWLFVWSFYDNASTCLQSIMAIIRMVWNDIITSETSSSIISSQAATSWHPPDAMSWRLKHWLFPHSTISGRRRDRAKIFSFLMFYESEKSMACRQDTWLWRVTLYIKVKSNDLTNDLSYLVSYACQRHDFCLFPWLVESRKSMTCGPDT